MDNHTVIVQCETNEFYICCLLHQWCMHKIYCDGLM